MGMLGDVDLCLKTTRILENFKLLLKPEEGWMDNDLRSEKGQLQDPLPGGPSHRGLWDHRFHNILRWGLHVL